MFHYLLLIPLLSALLTVRGDFYFFGEPNEDDFVDVEFNGCKECEHNYRNMVFILKTNDTAEQDVISIYSIVVLIMWFCLGALVALKRWRKIKVGGNHAYEQLR